jgi:hypothetical protein
MFWRRSEAGSRAGLLSLAITGTNDLMAKKPGERAVTEAPRDRTEDETKPVSGQPVGDDGKADPKGAAPPPSTGTEPAFDDPTVMQPVDGQPLEGRAKTQTLAMADDLGRPPEMPTSSAPPPLALGDVEEPTHMPGPRDIPGGDPSDRAPAPGRVPPGDSRSFRKPDEFALIYRLGTYVISRFGTIGTRGQWRVVEYPTSSSAAHSYAKEASRFVSEGFSDYRG